MAPTSISACRLRQLALASKVAPQGSRQGLLEHFKFQFAAAAGVSHVRSLNEQRAASDLERNMKDAADNAPVFFEAYYDACASLTKRQWLGHLPFRG